MIKTIKTEFLWMNVGDQESHIRKCCPMGLFMLELWEYTWDEDGMVFKTAIGYFHQDEHEWSEIKTFDTVYRDANAAKQALETWYELNVRTDSILLGDGNEI